MIRFVCLKKGETTNLDCSRCFTSSRKLQAEYYSRVQCKAGNVLASSVARVDTACEGQLELFSGISNDD